MKGIISGSNELVEILDEREIDGQEFAYVKTAQGVKIMPRRGIQTLNQREE